MPGTVFPLATHEELATLAVPIMIAQETLSRQPTRPFDAIEVVENAVAEIVTEVPADPAEGVENCAANPQDCAP